MNKALGNFKSRIGELTNLSIIPFKANYQRVFSHYSYSIFVSLVGGGSLFINYVISIHQALINKIPYPGLKKYTLPYLNISLC